MNPGGRRSHDKSNRRDRETVGQQLDLGMLADRVPLSRAAAGRLSGADDNQGSPGRITPSIKGHMTTQEISILQDLYDGERLEFQGQNYTIRGRRVPSCIARKMIKSGLVEPPPDLFTPSGGRITDHGRATLINLENDYDR